MKKISKQLNFHEMTFMYTLHNAALYDHANCEDVFTVEFTDIRRKLYFENIHLGLFYADYWAMVQ